MLDCARFLEAYSEFRDGLLEEGTQQEFELHLTDCASCRRYDRVVRRGAQLLCALPTVQPSDDFVARLQHRLDEVDAEAQVRRVSRDSGAPMPALLAIAATLAAVAWGPALQQDEPALFQLPPVAAHAPAGPAPRAAFGLDAMPYELPSPPWATWSQPGVSVAPLVRQAALGAGGWDGTPVSAGPFFVRR